MWLLFALNWSDVSLFISTNLFSSLEFDDRVNSTEDRFEESSPFSLILDRTNSLVLHPLDLCLHLILILVASRVLVWALMTMICAKSVLMSDKITKLTMKLIMMIMTMMMMMNDGSSRIRHAYLLHWPRLFFFLSDHLYPSKSVANWSVMIFRGFERKLRQEKLLYISMDLVFGFLGDDARLWWIPMESSDPFTMIGNCSINMLCLEAVHPVPHGIDDRIEVDHDPILEVRMRSSCFWPSSFIVSLFD